MPRNAVEKKENKSALGQRWFPLFPEVKEEKPRPGISFQRPNTAPESSRRTETSARARARNSSAYVKNLARVGARCAARHAGHETQQDLLRAYQFYSQAAQFGHAGANYELGVMFDEGVPGVVEKDPSKALLCFNVAADRGMAAAKFNLALMCESGRHVSCNLVRARTLLEEAARLNHAPSLFKLGEIYFQGKTQGAKSGAPTPTKQASEVEKKGAGLPSLDTVSVESDGGAVEMDHHKAVFYWGLAAELDYPKAIHALGIVYKYGVGPAKQSSAKAAALFELAAYCWVQQNHPGASAQADLSSIGDRKTVSSSNSRRRNDKARSSGQSKFALPEWLKMSDGTFPKWQERRFLDAKRPAPALAHVSSRSASARGAGLGAFSPLVAPHKAGSVPGSPAAAEAAVVKATSAGAAEAAKLVADVPQMAGAGAAALNAATAQAAIAAAGGPKARFVRRLENLTRAEIVSGSTFVANFEDFYLLPHALAHGDGAPTPAALRAAAKNVARDEAPFAAAPPPRPFQPNFDKGRPLKASANEWRLLEGPRVASAEEMGAKSSSRIGKATGTQSMSKVEVESVVNHEGILPDGRRVAMKRRCHECNTLFSSDGLSCSQCGAQRPIAVGKNEETEGGLTVDGDGDTQTEEKAGNDNNGNDVGKVAESNAAAVHASAVAAANEASAAELRRALPSSMGAVSKDSNSVGGTIATSIFADNNNDTIVIAADFVDTQAAVDAGFEMAAEEEAATTAAMAVEAAGGEAEDGYAARLFTKEKVRNPSPALSRPRRPGVELMSIATAATASSRAPSRNSGLRAIDIEGDKSSRTPNSSDKFDKDGKDNDDTDDAGVNASPSPRVTSPLVTPPLDPRDVLARPVSTVLFSTQPTASPRSPGFFSPMAHRPLDEQHAESSLAAVRSAVKRGDVGISTYEEASRKNA